MAQANQSDFLGEGTVDPFTGLAPAADEEALAAARRNQLRYSANNTANINAVSDRGGPDYSSMTSAQLLSRKAAGEPISEEQIAAAKRLEKLNHEAMNTAGYKALTYGILAAPGLITGGAGVFGGPEALGFGAGTGSISAENAGLAAAESASASATPIVPVVNEATGLAQAGPGFTQAAADSYNAAHGLTAAAVPATAAAATTAAGSVPSWLSDASAWGGKLATAAAPFLINEALGGRTKEQDALIAKQEQLAKEAEIRQGQQQDARMNALGQQLLAFNPTNQMMAQMFGPGAAFTPQQVSTMAQGQPPPQNPALENYHGTDPKVQAQVEEYIRRKQEFDQAEAGRKNMIMGGMAPVGPGPSPVQMGPPQAARRF